MDPYHKQLKALKKREALVTINRADAKDVIGRVTAVDEHGCAVGVPIGIGTMLTVYVAYRDIRGIASTGWDLDSIAG